MKNFKTYLVVAIASLLFFPIGASGQISDIEGDGTNPQPENPIISQPNGINLISCFSYRAITYNGHTINQISATEGEEQLVQQLWGSYTFVETIDIVGIIKYFYNSNRISFREGNLTGIAVKESNWTVKVLGKDVNVGDSFSELQQKFGDNLKIQEPSTSENYSVSFNCSENESNGFLIYLSPISHKVIEIKYYVSP